MDYLVGKAARFIAGCILTLAAFATVGPARAEASRWTNLADPMFVRIDARELPDSDVYSVAQDAAGLIWVGTAGGLARFDGYHFKRYLPNPTDSKALPDGYVFAMLADSTGLWLGTGSSGLVRFDARTETFRTWRPDRSVVRGPSSASVTALAADPGGGLWIGGNGGVSFYKPARGTFERVDLTARGLQPAVRSITIDRAGTVWIGTAAGLYERQARAGRFHIFRLRSTAEQIWSIYEDAAGRLWIGTENAVYVLDRERRLAASYVAAPSDSTTLAAGSQFALMEIRPGEMWVGSSEGELSVIDNAKHRVRRVAPDPVNAGGLTNGRVQGFLRDRSGLIWVANFAGGLLLYNPLSTGLHVLSASRPDLNFSDVYTVASVGNGVAVGGKGGSIALLDPISRHVTRARASNGSLVFRLLSDEDALWVGTGRGLCRLRLPNAVAQCPAGPSVVGISSVYALLNVDRSLWIGTRNGLMRENALFGLSNDMVRTLYVDRERTVWAGTSSGLVRIDPRSLRLTRYSFNPTDAHSIGPGVVDTILEDRHGRIWAGAYGGPLNVAEPSTDGALRFRHLDTTNGLPHENVDGLAEDRTGRIWASTDRGLAVIDPETLRARALGPIDGASDMNYHANVAGQAADGTIFFGGPGGVQVIEANASSPWHYSPPLVVTALEIGQRAIPVWSINAGATSVELPSSGRGLSVEFSALDYSSPETLRYAYKLEGFDRDWIAADSVHRTATYTNIPPGSYTLRIRGTNRLGVWSSRPIALRVTALPAWYETIYVRGLAVVLLVIALMVFHRLRIQALGRHARDLAEVVEKRTYELSEANAELEKLSVTDPLTGLRNRRFLLQHIDADTAPAVRRHEDSIKLGSVALPRDADLVFFAIDLDRFKTVNDTYGHAAGDHVLAEMRERLESVFRTSDYVLRWGGEEFLAVARWISRDDAPEIAERLRATISEFPFTVSGEYRAGITASVGFAAFPFVPSLPSALSWAQVVEIADHALYMAKSAGRNTWIGLEATDGTDPEAVIALLGDTAQMVVGGGHLRAVSREVLVSPPNLPAG